MDIVQYIKESCDNQQATEPEDYIGMTLAYSLTIEVDNAISMMDLNTRTIEMWFVKTLFAVVKNEPAFHWRDLPVSFADGSLALAPEHIERQLQILVDTTNQHDLEAERFYQLFEEIHPGHDGNGRVGSILYNWWNNTLTDPIHPPEFKKV